MYTDRQALHEEENLEGEGHELLLVHTGYTKALGLSSNTYRT